MLRSAPSRRPSSAIVVATLLGDCERGWKAERSAAPKTLTSLRPWGSDHHNDIAALKWQRLAQREVANVFAPVQDYLDPNLGLLDGRHWGRAPTRPPAVYRGNKRTLAVCRSSRTTLACWPSIDIWLQEEVPHFAR